MIKESKMTIIAVFFILLTITCCVVYSTSLNQVLFQKDSEINGLANQVLELEEQLQNQQKPSLVTSLGVSTEPRNVTYPHPHFTIEGVVFNVGNRTAYNARLEITAYYKNGLSAFNISIPLGNLEKWQVTQVGKIMATSEWIGNYTITPICTDIP